MSISSPVTDMESARRRISELEAEVAKLSGKSQEKIYRAIINQSPIGISVRDRNGNLVLCNDSWISIWRMSPEKVALSLSRKNSKLTMDERDDYLGGSKSGVAEVYRHGGDLILEPVFAENAGKWIQQRFYGVEGLDGTNEFVVILTEDVSDRKEAEEANRELRKSTEKYRKLVKNLPVAAYTTNSRGDLISANQAMVDMFEEASVDSLYSVPVSKRYLEPRERELFLRELSMFGRVNGYEIELVTRTGKTFWASVSATASLDEAGEVQTVDGVIRDVSALKILEKEMLKNQKLESIGILAGGIAHDFNNILAAVLGNISLARLYAAGERKAVDKLNEAEKATIRASELTKQLLTFSRGGKPVRKICDLKPVLRESASFASTGSSALVHYYLPGDLWAADVDEAQIGQVVSNLVLNAIQACTGKCRISISASNTTLEEGNLYSLEAGTYVMVSVSDDGPGIEPEVQERIFDPYFSTRPSGNGLGLATSYSIVKSHSGSISVDSVPGEGTTFRILLPSPGHTSGSDPALGVPRGKGRILIMDDEEGVRAVVSQILKHHGYITDEAAEGRAAVELFRESFLQGEPYDVIITDVTVPGGMGGLETAREILEIDPSAKMILASGYANNSAMANYRDHGFMDSIAKPFTMDVLLKSVEEVLACSGE